MGGREIVLWVCGIAVATALTIFGTLKVLDWYVSSDLYRRPGHTGVLPETK
jgi:hypothetical protein